MPAKSKSTECICHEETLTERVHCRICPRSWNEKLAYFERVSRCPQHNSSIAVCGMGATICEKCIKRGYTSSMGFSFRPQPLMKNGRSLRRSSRYGTTPNRFSPTNWKLKKTQVEN